MEGWGTMTLYEEQLNHFFVTVFNDILRLEESSLAKGSHKQLSVSEMHVIEAVCNSQEETNTMKALSDKLKITASSLTIAVKTLEQKGYLIRKKSETDKRKVYVTATETAKVANLEHAKFHRELVSSITKELNETEILSLTTALRTLHHFFIST
jgi:DNA-binding MarR family transcriptional regulator